MAPASPAVGEPAQNDNAPDSSLMATDVADEDIGITDEDAPQIVLGLHGPLQDETAEPSPSGPRTVGMSINHLLTSNVLESGPITPLATPPPSPGLSSDGPDGASGESKHFGHHRSHSRPIWPELFGSDG